MFIVVVKNGEPFFAHSATSANKQAVINVVQEMVQKMGITDYQIVEMESNPFPEL